MAAINNHNLLHMNIYSGISIAPRTPMYMSTQPHIHAHNTQSPSGHPLRNKNINLIVNKPMENYQTISKPEENYHETKNHSLCTKQLERAAVQTIGTFPQFRMLRFQFCSRDAVTWLKAKSFFVFFLCLTRSTAIDVSREVGAA